MSLNVSLALNKPAAGCWWSFGTVGTGFQLRAAWLYVAVTITNIPEVPKI
jgi:hypothetical protein